MANHLLIVSISLSLLHGTAASLLPATTSPKLTVACQAFRQSFADGGFLVYPLWRGISKSESCKWTTETSISEVISIDVTQSSSPLQRCSSLQILPENGVPINTNCSEQSHFFTLTNTPSATFRLVSGPGETAPFLFLFYSYTARNHLCQSENLMTPTGGVISSSSSSCAWYITSSSLPATQLIVNSRRQSSTSQRCNILSVYSLDGWFMRTYTVAQTTSIPYSTFILTCSYDPAGGDSLDVTYYFSPAPAGRADTATTRNLFTRTSPRTSPTFKPLWSTWMPPSWSSWTSHSTTNSFSTSGIVVIPCVVIVFLVVTVVRCMLKHKQTQTRNVMLRTQTARPTIYRLPTRTPASGQSAAGAAGFSNPAYSASPGDNATSVHQFLTDANYSTNQSTMDMMFNYLRRNEVTRSATADVGFGDPAFAAVDPIDAPPSYDDAIKEGSPPPYQANDSSQSTSEQQHPPVAVISPVDHYGH